MGQLQFNTEYLNDYLRMVEDTESPRIFHVWSAVWAAAASLGRRCKLPFGSSDLFPNHYVLLVGTPGTRKSTASGLAKRMVKQSTGVRFAPSDTGFQRQGFVLALQGTEDQTRTLLNQSALAAGVDSIMSLTDLAKATEFTEEEAETAMEVAEADKHHLAICASEFSRVIGQNNYSMLDFLGERYDGEDYEYKTRQSDIKMKNTLMNLLACTTPTGIANSLPPAAGGQGFLSRVILVYGARKYKKVPRPSTPPLELVSRVKSTLSDMYHQLHGSFSETPDAQSHCEALYDYVPNITDNRFVYYAERRYTHLIKLAMVLAATRGSLQIVKDDYEEANRILKATEVGMPDALGEFGMNPLAAVKQEILEQLRAHQGPLTLNQIVAMFHRDAKTADITQIVSDLVNTKLVAMSQLSSGERTLTAVVRLGNTEDQMMSLLAER